MKWISMYDRVLILFSHLTCRLKKMYFTTKKLGSLSYLSMNKSSQKQTKKHCQRFLSHSDLLGSWNECGDLCQRNLRNTSSLRKGPDIRTDMNEVYQAVLAGSTPGGQEGREHGRGEWGAAVTITQAWANSLLIVDLTSSHPIINQCLAGGCPRKR